MVSMGVAHAATPPFSLRARELRCYSAIAYAHADDIIMPGGETTQCYNNNLWTHQ